MSLKKKGRPCRTCILGWLLRRQVVLATCYHRFATVVSRRQGCLQLQNITQRLGLRCLELINGRRDNYILSMLAEISVLIHQLRNLFLQPIIFLHQQFIHRRQFPIHRLKTRRLFSLFFPASVYQ